VQTIAPAGDYLFAKPPEVLTGATQTKSGLFISASSVEVQKTLEVINVGPKVLSAKPGDTIIYKLYATTEFKLNDKTYVMLKDEDVLGVVKEVKETKETK
jgi:co-chaperonin GroES (HSP10)